VWSGRRSLSRGDSVRWSRQEEPPEKSQCLQVQVVQPQERSQCLEVQLGAASGEVPMSGVQVGAASREKPCLEVQVGGPYLTIIRIIIP
jgi:hypothetical protein